MPPFSSTLGMRRNIGKKSSISYHSWLIAGSKKTLQVNATRRRCLRPRFGAGFRLSLDDFSIKWEKINPKRSRLLKTFASALEFMENTKLEVQIWILSPINSAFEDSRSLLTVEFHRRLHELGIHFG
jgi:hypothetical protein